MITAEMMKQIRGRKVKHATIDLGVLYMTLVDENDQEIEMAVTPELNPEYNVCFVVVTLSEGKQ